MKHDNNMLVVIVAVLGSIIGVGMITGTAYCLYKRKYNKKDLKYKEAEGAKKV
jgi:hypothetical protein